jgi:hypothetical protein
MKVTQKGQVLDYMRTRGSITTFIAFDEFSICRLSERVRELERDGHLILHTPITRDGKSYVAYSLIEGEQKAA